MFPFRVVVLLDISATNSMYIIHIQHSLRLLLEEQLSNKDYFNLIAYVSPGSWGQGLVVCVWMSSLCWGFGHCQTTDIDVMVTRPPRIAIGLSDLDDLV